MSGLLDVLIRAARDQPRAGLHCWGGRSYTPQQLLDAASKAAGGAVAAGVSPGDPVLILVSHIDDFFPLFWGVLWAGATPVPLAGPRDGSAEELGRVRRVAEQIGGPILVDRGVSVPGMALQDVGQWLDAEPLAEPIRSGAPALIQFSSGSTRAPRGVVVRQEAMLANLRQCQQRLPMGPQDRALTWMPHHHDFGLIGSHLMSLVVGVPEWRMLPGLAMADPLRWARAVEEVRATMLSSTNLGLARLTRSMEQAGSAAPDLGSVRLIALGAEPLSPAVLRRFCAVTGLAESVLYPMYGLAESVVGLCAPPAGGLAVVDVDGREVVEIGPPLDGVSLRIVDTDGAEVPEGEVGRLWARGPNVFRGYWRDPEATDQALDGEWLDTGDLCVLHGGRLSVVGRAKDVICVGGRNLVAADVEAIAEEVPGVRPGGAVAVAQSHAEGEVLAVLVRVAPDADTAPVLHAVRRHVTARTGAEPAQVVPLDRIPRTTSGKKRRARIRQQLQDGHYDGLVGNTEGVLRALAEQVLGRRLADEELALGLREVGASSVQLVELLARAEARLQLPIDHQVLLQAPSLRALALTLERSPPQARPLPITGASAALAVVAAGCRFPGATDVASFQQHCREGVVHIGAAPPGRWPAGTHYAGGFVDDWQECETDLVGVGAEELPLIDPQQRLVLGLAREALRGAGAAGAQAVGVFVGAGQQALMRDVLERVHEPLPPGTMAGNLLSMIAARVSHELDLRGPALTVDTACSSSLVALHLARQSLQSGECELAVVAGVNLNLGPTAHRLFELAEALSPTGRCRPFQPDADGTVPGEGAGVVVVQPLAAAQAAGRPILGVIRATAINNDGRSLGIMAPNPAGQTAVIEQALATAGVDRATIGFVEAHGTGTPVGDAVERSVLARCYPHGPAIGASKATVGHLLSGAGMAGLLRALGEVAPGRRAAVSSFGFGGTNAHAILEAAPSATGTPRATVQAAPAVDLDGWLHVVARDPAGGLQWRPCPAPGPAASSPGRVLVLGATGGLGGHLVRHLAQRAGSHLVLVGRRAQDSAIDQLLDDVVGSGSRALYQRGDLADSAARGALIDLLRPLGPFDLAFHLAGVTGDGAEAVKAGGLAVLDALVPARSVLFSSISATLPGLDTGLETYVRANARLDAWARERHGAGGSDLSIAWPPWRGAGMAQSLGEVFAARGIEPLAPSFGLAALDAALATGEPHVVVLKRASLEDEAPLPEDLLAVLQGVVLATTGGDPDKLTDSTLLTEAGIDSLVALDVIADLEAALGRKLPTTLLFEHRTLGALAAALRGGAGRSAPAPSPTEPTPTDGAQHLLPSQETFVVQRGYFPDIAGNVLLACDALRDGGAGLARETLAAALALAVGRHPALSLRVRRVAGRWVQQAGRPPELRWVDRVVDAEAHAEIFDLETGPVLRVLCDGRRLLLNAHHSVVDAWSLKVVLEELLQDHETLHAGERPDRAPLRTTWADAVAVLRSAADDDVAWWKGRLAGAPPLPLAWRAPPSAAPRGPGRFRMQRLDAELTAALQAAARRFGTTLAAAVLTAYAEALWEASGQHDVTVRVAQGRRELRVADAGRLVGALADSLPVRIVVDPDLDPGERVRRVAAELAVVQARASSSARAVAAVGTRAGAGPAGLSAAGFSFPILPADTGVGGLRMGRIVGASASGFTRVGLIAWLFDGCLEGSWNFLPSHLDDAEVQRLGGLFEARVRALATAPGPQPATLHGRILTSCQRHAERQAVGTLSYRDLAGRSAALARRLDDAVPVPLAGRRVAVLGAPGQDAVVALLGVLRTGAAYVPLEPEWPTGRLAQVLASGEVDAVVATPGQAETAQGLAEPLELPVVVVDDQQAVDGPNRDGPVAYVMFTSGSTGQPKGVVVPHNSVLAFQRWVLRLLGVTPQDRFIQTSSLAFGGSIRQIYSPLLAGGSIHPTPPGLQRDPAGLLDFIEDQGITVFNSVPTLWARLADAAERGGAEGRLQHVRWVLVGGEAVPAEQPRRWRRLFGQRHRIANLYGSTETLVNATWFEVTDDPPADQVLLPIGWPRQGVDVHLLEPQAGLAELAVSGHIAAGYLGDPAQTARAFVDLAGVGRVWRSGDRVRVLPDGALVYVGRRDAQVQVRGNRVEPGEIEHSLCAQPGVRHALVVQDPDGRLYAAVEGPGDPSGLRQALAAGLPGWMVPHRIERLEALPRTPAGKLDRRALQQARSASAAPMLAAPAPPAQALLQAVRQAWRAVLDAASLPGDTDDFFAAGGDSLLLLDVLERLRAHVDTLPSPMALYVEPTPTGMAAAIARAQVEPSPAQLETPRAPSGPVDRPLDPVQRGFWLASQLGESPTWIAELPLTGPLDRPAFDQAMAWLVRRHDALRGAFVAGPAWRVSADPGPLPLAFDDFEALPDVVAERARQARWDEECHVQLPLERWPLVRARLERFGPERHRLLLSAHHAVADAWSGWVLAAELVAAHDAFAAGRTPDLPAPAARPEPPAPVRDPWWDRALAGLDQPPAEHWDEDLTLELSLPPAVWQAVLRRCRRQGITPYAVVLTALARALRDTGAGPDLVVSTALSGRGTETQGVVGPLAKALPVRVGPVLDPPSVARSLRQSLAHSDADPAWAVQAAGADGAARLGRWFLTWLDPSGVPAPPSALQVGLDQGRYRFAARATRTEVLVGAVPGDGLELHLHGGPRVRAVAPRLLETLRALAEPASALIVYPPTGVPVPLTEPRSIETLATPRDCSELVLLPHHPDGTDPERLERQVDAAVRASAATVVALAGMLPAWTGLGARPLGRPDQVVTTGHAATVVAVLLTVRRALRETGRRWSDTRLGVLGLGAIGQASLDLLRHDLGEPAAVLRRDPRLVGGGDALDSATLIVGATSGGVALDVAALPAGTIVVDDSFPRAFDDAAARQRMNTARDVLLVGGGSLDVGRLDRSSPFAQAAALREGQVVAWLPGCQAEAVLLARRPELGPTVGPVTVTRALQVLAAVRAEGWDAAPLHLGGAVVPPDVLQALRP